MKQLFRFVLGVGAVLACVLGPFSRAADINFSALSQTNTIAANDDLLINWKSNLTYYARRVAYSNLQRQSTNDAAYVATNVLINFSNTTALYVRSNGLTTGIRGRADKPWNSVSNALAAAQNGDTVFILPGDYSNQHLGVWHPDYAQERAADAIWQKTNVTVIGIGGPNLWYARTNTGLLIAHSSNVVVRGINFKTVGTYSTETTDNPPVGLMTIAHCDTITIEQCDFAGPTRFGILEQGQSWPSTNRIRVAGCYFEHFGGWIASYGWDGAGIACGGWMVENCFFTRCSRGVEIYPAIGGWAGYTRAAVRNCTFRDIIHEGISDGPHALVQGVITGNLLFNDTNGVSAGGSNLVMYPGYGINLVGGENYEVLGNTIAGFSSGIFIGGSYGCTNLAVGDNVILAPWASGGWGIRVGAPGKIARRVSLSRNCVGDSLAAWGLILDDGNDSSVVDNVIGSTRLTSSGGKGIMLRTCTNTFTSGNVIIDSQASPTTQYGISFEGGGEQNIVGYNLIKGLTSGTGNEINGTFTPWSLSTTTISNSGAIYLAGTNLATLMTAIATNEATIVSNSLRVVLVTNCIVIPAGAMAAGGGSTSEGGRNGATAGSWTNTVAVDDTWDFDDTTNECVVFTTALQGFAGQLQFDLDWAATNALNGASNVVWEVAVKPQNTNGIFGSWTYWTNQTDRFWSSNSLQTTRMPLISVTGMVPKTRFACRVTRLGTNTSDAAVGDVRLLRVVIGYNQTNYFGGF